MINHRELTPEEEKALHSKHESIRIARQQTRNKARAAVIEARRQCYLEALKPLCLYGMTLGYSDSGIHPHWNLNYEGSGVKYSDLKKIAEIFGTEEINFDKRTEHTSYSEYTVDSADYVELDIFESIH